MQPVHNIILAVALSGQLDDYRNYVGVRVAVFFVETGHSR